jgi:K+-sensing histidine kinase KdpD
MGRVAKAYRTIEMVEDDERRACHEENRLHVQNMVLDNCLSTLRHETVYYPNRIKQLVCRLDNVDERRQMCDLIAYYRVIFSTLANCASRQLEEVTFRRSAVKVDQLLNRAVCYHTKHYASSSMTVVSCDDLVQCDEVLVDFLLEQLIDAALAFSTTDELLFKAHSDGDFVCIGLFNQSRTLAPETLHMLFYPLRSSTSDILGTEYLVCRQIIREHDAYFNHVGCRIKAEAVEEGYVVWFTLPRAEVK